MARLQQVYKDEVAPALQQQFGYKSVMEVPRITKITLNMGVGEAVGDKKILEHAIGDMTKIAGQKPVVDQGAQVDRGLQDPRRLSDRLHGDPAWSAHVRIPRSPDHDRAAARA
jgi:hypothetical protein